MDYIGVFRNPQKALAIYSAGGGSAKPGEFPVMPKEQLVEALAGAIAKAEAFCAERGVSLDAIIQAEGFDRVKLLKDAADAMLDSGQTRREYLFLTADEVRFFRAISPTNTRATSSPKNAHSPTNTSTTATGRLGRACTQEGAYRPKPPSRNPSENA